MKISLKSLLVGISSLVMMVVLTGCVVAIGSGSRPPGEPPPVVVTDSADAATIAEIDAAARLNMDNSRTAALAQIAERPGLSVPVQVHLVNVTYRTLTFDNNRTHVLTKVIARSDFGDATRHAIVSQLGKLKFDNNQQQILEQINARLKTVPAH
jgi:hypothetical protein